MSSRAFQFSQAANTGINVLPDLTTLPAVGDVVSAATVATGKVTWKYNGPAGVGVFLPLTGGTVTGPITLSADPLSDLHSASKHYVDASVSGSLGVAANTYVTRIGDTMTGMLTLPATTPTLSTHAVSKAYVDGAILTVNPVTTTNTTVARMLADRFADVFNLKDFNAPLDGVGFDGTAINAALAKVKTHQGIYLPSGGVNIAGISTTPTTPVHWLCDGNTLGATNNQVIQFQRSNLGDLVENYNAGTKGYFKKSANLDSYGMLRLDYQLDFSGGTGGAVSTLLRINAADNAGAVTSMWGVHVAMDSYSNQAPWPQNVGISSTFNKRGAAWGAGMHITAADYQNLPSLTGGPLLGLEIGIHTNDLDNAFSGSTFGGAGIRSSLHLSFGTLTGVTPGEFAAGINFTGVDTAVIKSILAIGIGTRTFQALDTRGAIVPVGYTDPVASVRMLAGQIIDFNGGAALNSAAGTYLQYTASGGARLRAMFGGTEVWSVTNVGNQTVLGSVNAGNLVTAVNGATFGNNTTNATVVINGPSAAQRQLRWQNAGSMRWSAGLVTAESTGNAGSNWVLVGYDDTGASLGNVINITRSSQSVRLLASFSAWNANPPAAKPAATGSRAGNAALASLLTLLATYGLLTDSTTA